MTTRIITKLIGSLMLLWMGLGLALAQTTIKGRVLEADKKPLPFANVRLLHPTTGKMVGGIATDNKGAYSISKVDSGTYQLEVSFIGYATHRQSVKVGAGTNKTLTLKDITLKEDGTTLKELVVAAKATEVTIKGDTIEYNAESFKTTEGAALEELIKKLPGAEISESGEITINGKGISQIMVDGKRFFESDPKVAIKNLPAELVQKVQVLDKQSDAARMTGFADGEDETILNLTIKPGRKQGLFGTLYAGAGNKQRYEAGGIVNRFTDGKQWTVLGGTNNTNNAGFSDIASDISQSDVAMQASGSSRRPWERSTANDGVTISHILGGNAALTFNPKTELGGNIFYGNSDKNLTTTSQTTHLQSQGNTVEDSRVVELNNKNNYGTALRLEWKPDSKTELIISPRLSFGTGEGSYSSQSSTSLEATGANITTSQLHQTTESRVYSARVDANMSRKLSDNGRTLALMLDARLSGDDTDGYYESNIYTASTASSQVVDQRLETDASTKTLRTRLNYVEPLGKGYALQLTYQLRGEFSSTNRSSLDRDASGAYSLANPSYSYDFESNFWAHRAGLAFKKASTVYDLTLGLNIDPSRLVSDTRQGSNTRHIVQSVVNYSPTLRYSYKPSKAFNVRIDYRGRSYQPTASQLAPISDPSNPLSVYVGNEDLLPAFRHMLMGHMSVFSAKKQSALNIFLGANVVQNEIVSDSRYDLATGVRTTTYTNVNGSWQTNLGGFFTTPIFGKRLSLRLGSMNSLRRQVGFIDGLRNNAHTLTLSENLAFAYRHGWVDTSVKGSWAINRLTNSLSTASGSTTRDYALGWDLTLSLPIGLSLESNLSYTTTSGYASGYNQEQTLWNASLSYSFLRGKVATLRLKAYDLLGQQRNVYRNVSAIAVSSQETNTIGQYAMLHFIYRFNSFSGNASAKDMKQEGMRRGPGGPPPGRF